MHEKVHQAVLRISCKLAHCLLSVVRRGLPLHSCEDSAFCNHHLQRNGFWEGSMDWGGLSSCSPEEPHLPWQAFFRTSKETICDVLGPTFSKYREEIMANPQPGIYFFFLRPQINARNRYSKRGQMLKFLQGCLGGSTPGDMMGLSGLWTSPWSLSPDSQGYSEQI